MSECINAGDTAYAYVSTIDYLDNQRIIDIIDIGAFEYQNDVNLTQNKPEMNFKVYPNPASKGSIVMIESSDQTKTINVYSLSGKLVKTISTESQETLIDTSDLTPGIYFIHASGYIPVKLVIN